MSETAPSVSPALEKERVKLANEQAKLEQQFASEREKLQRKEETLAREELFGKYDETTPAKGEVTYQEYVEQRPADGAYRIGDKYHDAKSGNFVPKSAYDESRESTVDYENRVGDLLNKGEYEPPHYDEMSYFELVKATADANELGDRAAVDDIRAEIAERLTMEIVNEGNDEESSEAAQERYDKELHKFEFLVDRYMNGPEALHNGERIVVGEVFSNGKANVAEVYDDDGTVQLVREQDLTLKAPLEIYTAPESQAESESQPLVITTPPEHISSGADPAQVPTFEADPDTHVKRFSAWDKVAKARVEPQDVSGPEAPARDAEPNPNSDTDPEATDTPADVEPQEKSDETEKASRRERFKAWFGKERKAYQEYGGAAYWAARWEKARMGFRDHVLDYGVTAEMSDEQKEKRRKNNRTALIAGAGVLAVGAAIAIGISIHDAGGVDQIEAPKGGGIEVTAPAPELPDVTEVSVETPPPAPEYPVEAFDIPKGGSGWSLLESLGVEPTSWFQFENDLLRDFPDELYRMADGHVGIAKPGPLSAELQEQIIANVRR